MIIGLPDDERGVMDKQISYIMYMQMTIYIYGVHLNMYVYVYHYDVCHKTVCVRTYVRIYRDR